jgi:hypothetical protein
MNQKISPTLITLIICIIIATFSSAQPIKKIQNRDTLYHLYTLNNVQLLYLQGSEKNVDTAWLFSNSYKKLNKPFMESLDSVQNGTYLQASIIENKVYYTVVEKLPFLLSTKKIDDDVLIYLKNKDLKNPFDKHIIANAKVYYGNILLPYDSSYGAYVTNLKTLYDKELLKKYIAITYNDKHYIQNLNVTIEVLPKQRRVRNSNSTHSLGYCISDKPIYKLGDSLHFKAYLIDNDKGNPIKTNATIYINDAQTNKIILTKSINSITPGAFVYDWKIPDTLLQDRNYIITIGYKKNMQFISRNYTFRMESYLLNKNLISVSPTQSNYRSGENIAIKVNTTDANGFPLGDVRLQYTVSLANIMGIDKDTLLLTKEMRGKFITVDTILPYEKLHDFVIDYKKLPKAKMTLNFIGTAIDAQFEKIAFNFNVVYNPIVNETKLYQKADTLFIKHLHLTRDTIAIFTLKCYDAMQKLVDSIVIKSPYNYLLKPSITSVVLYKDSNVVTSQSVFYNVLNIMQVKGEREAKQIKISFQYPFAEGVHYRIKKGNTLVKKGFATNIKYVVADSTLDAYSILLSNNINGNIENNFYKISFYALGKKVNISSTIPADAFPGQTIPIEFTATDWHGKPIPNFNIASYAVNSMFQERLSEPFIDVPDSFKRSMHTENISGNYSYLQYYPISVNAQHFISKAHVVRYNLYKNEYYQLLYPKQGYQLIKNKKQQPTPELAILLSYKGVLYTPKYCMIDSNIVSIGKINNVSKYSFACDSGKHSIAIRAFDRYITISNVYLNNYTKHYLSINLDSVRINVHPNFVQVSDSLSFIKPSLHEAQKLENSLLFTYSLAVDSIMQITNSNNTKKQFTYFSNNFESVQIDDDAINVIGPINSNMALLNNKHTTYNLSVGRFVHYYDYSNKTFNSKTLDKKSVIALPFQEQIIAYNYLPFLLDPDTIAKEKLVTQNITTEYDNEIERSFNLNNYYFNQPINTNAYYQIQIFQSAKKQITNVWIINNDIMEQSVFTPYSNSIVSYNANKPVDIFLFASDQTVRIIKNISMPTNAIFYINADSLQTDTLSEKDLSKALEVFNTITRTPVIPFYYNPQESNNLVLEKTSYKNTSGNAYLKGNILNNSLTPLPETYILLEQGGKYKAGAITNEKGEFEFLKLTPGIYDIKIYNANYTLKYYYQAQIGGAYSQYFSSILTEREGQLPDFESINNNYRLSTFEQKTKSEIIVNVYDYKTRQLITDSKINWCVPADAGKNCIAFKTSFSFTNTGSAYILKVRKAGYKSFDLSGILFDLQNKTVVDVFLSAQTKDGDSIEYYNITTNTENSFYAEPNTISGRITDENSSPLEFATIRILDGAREIRATKSDANGFYKVKPLAAGDYTLKVNYVGYLSEEVTNVSITNTKGAIVNFKLERSSSKRIASVVVSKKRENGYAMIDKNKAGQTPGITAKQVERLATSSTLNASSLPAGSYQSDNVSAINLGGARSGNTEIMIDGVMVKDDGRAQLPKGALDEIELINSEKDDTDFETMRGNEFKRNEESEKMKTLFNNILNAGMGSQYRKTFADVGYWKPNLTTDAQGKSFTSITLPDNITQWQSYTVGMGSSFTYGQTSQKIKVYKPMQTITYTPSFLHQGDSLYVKAKFTNLMTDTKKCDLFFTVNGKPIKNYSYDLQKQMSDSIQIFANDLEPIAFTAGLKYLDKYTDAETLNIPVLSNAITLYNNQNIYADADSNYILQVDSNTKGTVIFNNVIYERILQYIQDLKNYQYGCVEQTASKLKALIYEEQINKKLQRKINVQSQIIKCVNKLQDMQNSNGSFGWWRKGYADLRMTTYALEALSLANKYGYSSTATADASSYLLKELRSTKGAHTLYTIYTLQKNGFMDVSGLNLKGIQEETINTTDKIYLYKIKQLQGEPIDNALWYSLLIELENNSRIRYCDNFFYDHKANIFNAYTIFKGTSIEKDFAEKFRTKITNGQLAKDLNTFSKASLIEAMLVDAAENNNPVMAEIIINDTLKVKAFPYTYTIANTAIKIKHKGAPVWINTAEAYQIENPIMHDSIFNITTQFVQNNSNTPLLKRGEITQLQINIMAYKSKDYVMIEVPLPAGIIIKNKPALPNTQDYIEYKNDKIIIYKTNMPLGNTNFTIDVQPIYTGTFNMPAAQIGMMYYPFIFGNNVQSVVPIQ